MDILLEEDSALFTKYAMSDTRVTLEDFINFHNTVYESYGVSKITLTVGHAVVEAFMQFIDGRDDVTRESIFGLERARVNDRGRMVKRLENTSTRHFTEALASTGYLGGLNTAYETSDYVCSQDEIILDLDFSRGLHSGDVHPCYHRLGLLVGGVAGWPGKSV